MPPRILTSTPTLPRREKRIDDDLQLSILLFAACGFDATNNNIISRAAGYLSAMHSNPYACALPVALGITVLVMNFSSFYHLAVRTHAVQQLTFRRLADLGVIIISHLLYA